MERGGEAPAHDLTRVHIGRQVEVAAIISLQGNIGDVADPKLVWASWHHSFCKEFVLTKAVVAIGCGLPFTSLIYKTILPYESVIAISARHLHVGKQRLRHQSELLRAYTGVQGLYVSCDLYQVFSQSGLLSSSFQPLIIRLARVAKGCVEILFGVQG